MAQMEWTRPTVPVPSSPASLWRRLVHRFLDWEDWFTFGLALAAVFGVSLSLEGAGWSRDMPSLSLVGLLALLFALLLARSPLPMLLAWPLAAVAGASVTFWQTLEMVGPGDLGQRIDAIYFRFQTWFHLAFTGGISNDSLPFNVMVVGLTWLGVFLFGWSLYRWHNAWLGLIPGGVALFLNLVMIGDSSPLPLPVFIYVLIGLTLLMRTNLMARMRQWRAEGIGYPPLISLSFFHYSIWASLFLLIVAWIAPAGPFATPGPVNAFVERLEGLGLHFVRLAGPLRVEKIIPVHDYTAILPFQGSIDLSESELLSVRVTDPFIEGPIILRGAVYQEYASGGWKAGPRREVDAPSALGTVDALSKGDSGGRIVPAVITVEAESVLGTVLFTPGQPLSAGVPARAKLSEASISELSAEVVRGPPRPNEEVDPLVIPMPGDGGASLSDGEILALTPPGWTGLYVRRGDGNRVEWVGAYPSTRLADVLVLSPSKELNPGDSYGVLGVVSDISPDELRASPSTYPAWVRSAYQQLPAIPDRVRQLAQDVAGEKITPYDSAKAIESYLRRYPIGYGVVDTPPGRDAVDYFLFEARGGYFDYHASAMVVLLRAIGIPSRLAVGFVIDRDDFDDESGSYVAQHKDAYAWVEVYFPGPGWIEFNPSPDRPADLRPRERSGEIVIPPVSPEDLRNLPVAIDAFFPIDAGDLAGPGGTSSGGSGAGYTPWIALAIAGWAVAVAGSAALGWRHSVTGLPHAQQLWEKTVRLASWAGHPPGPGQTPSDFAAALARSFRGVRDIDLLAQAYNRSRFGHKDTPAKEKERLASVWAQLRGPLAGEIIRRLWRRS